MKGQNYIKRNEVVGRSRAKKRFGQHFLREEAVAEKIADYLEGTDVEHIIEIGPGRGIMTKTLTDRFGQRFHAVEIDRDLAKQLHSDFPNLNLVTADFLKLDLGAAFPGSIAIIGNFPYNISTQILFRVLDFREQVKTVVGMFQREVAKRVVANPGGKDYGIISVLLSAWYDRQYLFELPPDAFNPPPKVHSAVIKLTRNQTSKLDCDEQLLQSVVKTAFNKRRKMLRNSLSGLIDANELKSELYQLRPERLSLEQFIQITKTIAPGRAS